MGNFIKIVCFLFLLLPYYVFTQRVIEFTPVYGSQAFTLNKYYLLGKSDSVKIDGVKFYISSLEFLNEDKTVFSEKESFHLLDVSNPGKLKFPVNIPADRKFTKIRFNIGIDSLTNVSGALGGDLDPTLGMYWTWQSGYINVKIEGRSNVCKTRLNEFSLHLGGYLSPNLSVKTVQLEATDPDRIAIYFDLKLFLENVGLEKQNQIMSPGSAAVSLSQEFSNIFSCK